MAPNKTLTKSTTTAERTMASAGDRAARHARRSASTPASDTTPEAPTAIAAQSTPLTPVAESPAQAERRASPLDVLAEAAAQADVDSVYGGINTTDAAPSVGSPTPSEVMLPASPTPAPATPLPQHAVPAHKGGPIYVPSQSPSPRRDDFPPLPSPGFEPVLSHAQRRKQKGKQQEREPNRRPPPSSAALSPSPPALSEGELPEDNDTAYAYAADVARATAMSLGLRTDADGGASSSRRPHPQSTPRRHAELTTAESPSKRQRANTSGRAIPRPAAPFEDPTPLEDPQHDAPPRDGLTVDGNASRGTYNSPPEGGFREVYGITETVLFRGIPDAQRKLWDAIPHPKIVATIAGGNGDRIETTAALREHIANRFNMDLCEVEIGTPGLPDGKGPDAIAWLITGLHIDHAQALLDMRALVSDTLTVFFHAYRPVLYGFGGTFQGFTVHPSQGHVILDHFARVIADDTSIARFIRSHRDAFPAYMTNEDVFTAFIQSLWVHPLQLKAKAKSARAEITGWNLYFDSPTNRVEAFDELTALLKALVINTGTHGQGRLFPRPLRCTICNGADHSVNLCPMHDTDGYLGVTAESVGALLDISREAREASNPRGKPGRDSKFKGNSDGKGKGKGNGDGGKGGNNRHRNNAGN